MNATTIAAAFVQSEFDIDDDGYVTSVHPIFPPFWEVVIGASASIIVFVLLYKFAWPEIKKGMKARTARIQGDIDDAADGKAVAEKQAGDIRTSLGDIDAERARLFAEADTQAEALLTDGRVRLDAEVAELEARADIDIASAATRGSDDLRADIARYTSDALEQVVSESLDAATQQDLIEGFIARVGATS